MKRIILIAFALIMLIGAKTLVAQDDNEKNQSEEKIKPWTDVVKNTSDPASWTWNKNVNTRNAIRGDWDGDGFDEMLYESATKLFSDNDDITPLNLPGDLGVFFLINEGDLDGDGGDEISFMSVNRDWSNLNVMRIWSYNGYRWKEILQTEVHIWDCPNYRPETPEESFTQQWKRKNNYSLSKVVLKLHDGIIDVIGINPNGRYAIEEIKILDKSASKRKWGMIIQPRDD
ncbi:MAG: hypothetical protein H6Q16_1043 [Bacteroidetes bacterium]|nr:hypothetical protein [Bacteroidota bacterium]